MPDYRKEGRKERKKTGYTSVRCRIVLCVGQSSPAADAYRVIRNLLNLWYAEADIKSDAMPAPDNRCERVEPPSSKAMR